MNALLVVDVQYDFLPGGALGVPDGDAVIPEIIRLTKPVLGLSEEWMVVATRDAHPPDHCSFVAQGGPWPEHCVEGTHGAEIHPAIKAIADRTISKGSNPRVEQYSGFAGTHLADMLRVEGFDSVTVVGLATDYCVKATAIDAAKAGFNVEVILDCCRPVNVEPDDDMVAIGEMLQAGVTIRGRRP